MTNPKIATLCDKFDQGAINSDLWSNPWTYIETYSGGYGSPGTITSASISANFSLATAPNYSVTVPATSVIPAVHCGDDEGIGSVIPYDLTDSGLSARIVSSSSVGGTYHSRFLLSNNNSGSVEGFSWFGAPGPSTAVYNNPGGGQVVIGSASGSFNFVRIRESGGTVYFDYSADGVNWTNAGTYPDTFDLTNVYVSLYGKYISGAGTANVVWADVNYVL